MIDPKETLKRLLQEITLNRGGGLVLGFAFEDAGNLATDISNGEHVGAINGAGYVASKSGFGNCLSFNGIAAAVLTQAKRTNLHIRDELTLMGWVYPTAVDSNWRCAFGDWGGVGDGRSIWLGISADLDEFTVYSHLDDVMRRLDSGITPSVDTWYHIAATLKVGTALKIYVNGDLKATLDLSGTTGFSDLQPSQSFSIACRGDYTDWFEGYIDEALVYNKVLTDAEILAYYTANIPLEIDPAVLITCDEFDENVLKHHDGIFTVAMENPAVEQTINLGGDKFVKESYRVSFWTRTKERDLVGDWLRWKATQATRAKLGAYNRTPVDDLRRMFISVPRMATVPDTQPPILVATLITATRRIVDSLGEPT